MSETIQATVLRVRFHNADTGFTVLLAAHEESREEVTIIGSFPPVDEDDPIVATGSWHQDRKWGRQFAAESLTVIVPTSREGIEAYLSAGHVKGIGAGLAKRLLDEYFFPAATPEAAAERVIDLVTERIPKKFGFSGLRDVQVLALMRPGAVGIDGLNRDLQRALNPPERHKVRVERPNGVVFLPRDKVMQTVNNYDKEVFNGDVGVLAAIDAEKRKFTVDFGARSGVTPPMPVQE